MRIRGAPGSAALLLAAVALNLTVPEPGTAQAPLAEEDDLLAALNGGRGTVAFRYRLELVDQDGFDEEAWASTLRTAIAFQTKRYRGCDLFLETVNVADVGDDAYDNTRNGRTDRPVVVDPTMTRMNRAFLRATLDAGAGVLGRQELVFDNARFVGNVGWRQNHQVFDALRADWSSGGRLALRYTFVVRAHRINGTRTDLDGHLGNAELDVDSLGRLAAYAYLLDFEDAADAGASSNTLGGHWTGKRALSGGKWTADWRAEYAIQRDAHDNPDRVEADYVHLTGAIARAGAGIRVGWERLSGDAEDGRFTTPFATLHKFNGWADRFLATPAAGLRDLYVTLSGKWKPFHGQVTWHDFRDESGGTEYGSELDALVGYRTPWSQTVELKAARYSADRHSDDTTKIWAITSFDFAPRE